MKSKGDAFCELPLEVKSKYSTEENDNIDSNSNKRGYIAMEKEA